MFEMFDIVELFDAISDDFVHFLVGMLKMISDKTKKNGWKIVNSLADGLVDQGLVIKQQLLVL